MAKKRIRNADEAMMGPKPSYGVHNPVPKTKKAKDAEYRIRQLEVTLVRGSRPVTKQTFTTQKLNLAQFVSQARAGDRLVVEIKQVTRKTYEGKNEPVQLRNAIFNIPLN